VGKNAAWLRTQTAEPELQGAHGATMPDGRRLIQFRARRQLSLGGTFVRSWVVRRGDSPFDTLRLLANKGDGDGKGERHLIPLAWLQIGGRAFWVCTEFEYEGSLGVIIEVAPRRPTRLLDIVIG
jgi:hypothetical protein